tara:strand:- start:2660 stop:2863 length:204 start_codon:yes stop_codon:yes gene_type:complete
MKIDQRFTVGVILGLILIVILACADTATSNANTLRIDTIDGCEYVNKYSNYSGVTHHANCHNPIHNK